MRFSFNGLSFGNVVITSKSQLQNMHIIIDSEDLTNILIQCIRKGIIEDIKLK